MRHVVGYGVEGLETCINMCFCSDEEEVVCSNFIRPITAKEQRHRFKLSQAISEVLFEKQLVVRVVNLRMRQADSNSPYDWPDQQMLRGSMEPACELFCFLRFPSQGITSV